MPAVLTRYFENITRDQPLKRPCQTSLHRFETFTILQLHACNKDCGWLSFIFLKTASNPNSYPIGIHVFHRLWTGQSTGEQYARHNGRTNARLYDL